MGKFRKIPIVVDAFQWDGKGHEDVKMEWTAGMGSVFCVADDNDDTPCAECGGPYREHLNVHTLEGNMYGCIGDWIITGIKGEKYPCKDEIFKMTYEPVDDCDLDEFAANYEDYIKWMQAVGAIEIND